MDSTEWAARKGQIFFLGDAFPLSQGTFTESVRQSYQELSNSYSLEAVKRAVSDFRDGLDNRPDKRGVPSGPEFAQRCRLWHEATAYAQDSLPQLVPYRIGEDPPEGHHAAGVVDVDFGHRRIKMASLSKEDQDRVLTSSGRDIPQQQIGRTVMPRLGKM